MEDHEYRIKQIENKILSHVTRKHVFGEDHVFLGSIDFEQVPTINDVPITNNLFAQFESNSNSDINGGAFIPFTTSTFISNSGFELTNDSKGIIIPKSGYYNISYKVTLSFAEGGEGSTIHLNVNSVNVVGASIRVNIPNFGFRNKILILSEGDILSVVNDSGIVTLDNTYEAGCQITLNFLSTN